MGPYIFGKRNGIHIIDIRETVKGLLRAKKFLAQRVSQGDDVLFVGTKRQAREAVREHTDRCQMHYVIERWLGGTLTNFRTIRSRLQRLEELEGLVAGSEWETGYSKKMKSTLLRELRKIQRNLGGVRRMNRLPGVLVVVDVRKETNALREARHLGIPTICLIDTDSDPGKVDLPIPGNDDSLRSVDVILKHLADAVEAGTRGRPVKTADNQDRGSLEGAPAARRRNRGARPEPAPAATVAAPAASDAAPVSTETTPPPTAEQAPSPVEQTPPSVEQAPSSE